MCQPAGGVAMIVSVAGVVPFINQLAASPFAGSEASAASLYCHRISDLPSPLKSPVAMACQLGGGLAMIVSSVGAVPFISQIAASPFAGSEASAASLYCHR